MTASNLPCNPGEEYLHLNYSHTVQKRRKEREKRKEKENEPKIFKCINQIFNIADSM